MKIAALISGGKDSIFSIMHCKCLGHEIVALGNLYPKESEEIDSWMYQSIGSELVPLLAECIGLPLIRKPILGKSLVISGDYKESKGDEVEDLVALLSDIKLKFPDIQGVCCGAILSSYQRVRVENVCSRLGLAAIAPLWMHDQNSLLQNMISSQVGAVIVKTAAVGLNESDLGKQISTIYHKLLKLNQLYDLHICGEGGEYETFTLDAPFFLKRIEIVEREIVEHSDGVWYLIIKKAIAVEKDECWNEWNLDFQRMINEEYESVGKELDTFADLPRVEDLHLVKYDTMLSTIPQFEVTISAKDDTYVAVSGLSVERPGSVFDDTQNIMEQLELLLVQNDSSLQNAIQVTIYMNDITHFSELNRAYSSFVSRTSPPTRVTVEICLSCSIQIDVLSYTNKSHIPKPVSLYVQGISYWAPANIGPYSQAVRYGDTIWFSGMIGLVPSSMKLAPPFLQGKQSLESVKRVAKAMNSDLGSTALSCVCYITDLDNYAGSIWEQESDISCLIVKVPCLPKKAGIEWQVVVFSLDGYKNCLQNNPDIDLDPSRSIIAPERKIENYRLESGHIFGNIQKVTQGNSCFITGWADSLNLSSNVELLTLLIEKIRSLKKPERIVSIRIFYSAKHLFSQSDQNHLIQLISNCSFTFVPVIHVMRTKTAVGISIFLKKECQDLAQIAQKD